jgi:hypothetical protein
VDPERSGPNPDPTQKQFQECPQVIRFRIRIHNTAFKPFKTAADPLHIDFIGRKKKPISLETYRRFDEMMRRNELNARLRTEEINRTEVELPEPDKLTATHVELGKDVKNSAIFPGRTSSYSKLLFFFKGLCCLPKFGF